MSDVLDVYRKAESALPERISTWYLYGAGMENFGKDKKPVETPVPKYGPDELLVRIDAVGVCFSDIKVIKLGNGHPRITGRDLVKNPVTLGHEPAVTVVGVGANLEDKYRVGQRFIVQADVFYQGKSMAFGYVLAGAQTQYQALTKELLNGDEGAYVIPLADSTGYAEGAMTEAWSCVTASYRIRQRSALQKGGKLWIVAAPDDDGKYTLDMEIPSAKVFVTDARGDLLAELESGDFELVETSKYSDMDLAAFGAEHGPFDDIIFLGTNAEMVEAAAKLLGPGGIITLVAREPLARPVSIDVGKVHYQNHGYFGTSGRSIAGAYKPIREKSEIRKGGCAWFIGGAGPMGKMHVQLALEMDNGPAKVLVTDIGAERLESASKRFEPMARSKGIEFLVVNPSEMSKQDFDSLTSEFTGGKGFDDIVVLAPVGALIAGAVPYLAKEGQMNIFAGVPIGTMADMDLTGVYTKKIRFLGSSGSRLSDMRDTVEAAESGRLSPGTAVAGIGGIEASWDAMLAVMELKFTGKLVIFPQIHGLELTALPELKHRLPKVYAKLTDGEFWNNAAEEELLREMLEIPE